MKYSLSFSQFEFLYKTKNKLGYLCSKIHFHLTSQLGRIRSPRSFPLQIDAAAPG